MVSTRTIHDTETIHDTVTKTVFVTVGGAKQTTIAAQAKTTKKATTTQHAGSSKITPPAQVKGGSNQSSFQGGQDDIFGGNQKEEVKFVTVTQTIKHIKPVTKTITKTKNNGKVFTTTSEVRFSMFGSMDVVDAFAS